MRKAIKSKLVHAYELGAGSTMEIALIQSGKILPTNSGYELFSQEAVNGKGQQAVCGDFFKVDNTGAPYPNERAWFLAHHQHLEGDTYLQKGEPVLFWQYGDPVSEELLYLLKTNRLRLNNEDSSRYFEAELWGALLTAARDATLVFYSVDRDANGTISDISFNFVAKSAFEQDYQLILEDK